MDKKYGKFNGDMDMDDVFKAADAAFEKAQEAFDMAGKHFDRFSDTSTSKTETTSNDNKVIEFTGHRWASFWKFIKCAFQILFTDKTSITFKHR